jgi:hypothetical protein
MDAAHVIRLAKTAIAEVDTEAVPFADERLLQDIADVCLELGVRGVPGFDTYVVDIEEDPEAAVVPPFTNQHGLIVAYRVAENRLRESYQQRMNRGELGISWTSGLESESTVSAAKAYQELIGNLRRKADELLTLEQMARTQGARIY